MIKSYNNLTERKNLSDYHSNQQPRGLQAKEKKGKTKKSAKKTETEKNIKNHFSVKFSRLAKKEEKKEKQKEKQLEKIDKTKVLRSIRECVESFEVSRRDAIKDKIKLKISFTTRLSSNSQQGEKEKRKQKVHNFQPFLFSKKKNQFSGGFSAARQLLLD